MWKAVKAWEQRKFTPEVLEELEEIKAPRFPRYLDVSICGTGGAKESGWIGRSSRGAQDLHIGQFG